MERKIGEIFEYNGEWYQCVNTGNCSECAFTGKRCYDFSAKGVDIIGDCTGRTFKKLEKVGEPMKIHDKLVLKVKADAYKCMNCCFYSKGKCELTMQECEHYDCGEENKFIEIKQNKENMEDLDKIKVRDYTKVEELNVMEEKKLNLKPFDIHKAREGKPVCTRDGRKARIICFDRKFYHDGYNYPIVAMVDDNDNELVHAYTQDGLLVGNMEGELDLMMLPEKKEGWVNIYKSDNGTYYTGAIFYEKNDALVNTAEIEITTGIPRDCIDTVKVCWEE